jgi:hypothetical protein
MEQYKTINYPNTPDEIWAIYSMPYEEFMQLSPEDQEYVTNLQDWVQSKMD